MCELRLSQQRSNLRCSGSNQCYLPVWGDFSKLLGVLHKRQLFCFLVPIAAWATEPSSTSSSIGLPPSVSQAASITGGQTEAAGGRYRSVSLNRRSQSPSGATGRQRRRRTKSFSRHTGTGGLTRQCHLVIFSHFGMVWICNSSQSRLNSNQAFECNFESCNYCMNERCNGKCQQRFPNVTQIFYLLAYAHEWQLWLTDLNGLTHAQLRLD